MKINIKFKEIFFLSILLLLLPAKVNAEDVESLNSDVGLETNVVENTVAQETKVDAPAEDKKIEAVEENSNQDTKDNEVIENSEKNQAVLEEDLSQDTKDNEVIGNPEEKQVVLEEENQEALKNDEEVAPKKAINTSDSEELGIGEEIIPEALRGGSSGGSGSGYVSSPGYDFVIIKKDENGNPMRVAFKITNLVTGETHILVTDSEGRTNKLFLNDQEIFSKDKDPLMGMNFHKGISQKEIEEIVKELQKTKEIIDPENKKPDIFGNMNDFRDRRFQGESQVPGGPIDPLNPPAPVVEPPVPGGEPQDPPRPNINDNFLEKGIVKDLYEYEKLKRGKNTETRFVHSNLGSGSLELKILISKIIKNGNENREEIVSDLTIDYGDLPAEKFNQVYTGKIIDYTKKFLADKLIKDSNGGPINYADGYVFDIFIAGTQKANVDDIYKVEELRTDTNKGYSLKTFYIRRELQKDWQGKGPNERYKFFMGYSEDKITEEAQIQDLGMCPPPIDPGYGPGQVPPPKMPPLAPRSAQAGFELGENIVPAPLGGGSSGGSGSGYVSSEPINPMCMPTPTFTIVNEKFNFNTYASHPDQGDNKILVRSAETRVTDKIKFDKLSEGKEYRFVGRLIHKATGEVVQTKEPIIYETGKLTSAKGEASITITFDSSVYSDGDEFVLFYDIYEDGLLAGSEDDLENKDQTFSIIDEEVPPPPKEVPPPPKEVPPPEEEVPPPKEEVPPPVEENKEEAKVVEEKTYSKPTPDYIAPKTYDSGIGLNIIMLALSGAGFTLLRKKNK